MKLKTVRYISTGLLSIFIILVLITVFTNDPVFAAAGFIPVIMSFFIMYRYWKCPYCGQKLRGLIAGTKGHTHCENCGEEIDPESRINL